MQAATLRLTGRLLALTVSTGALAIMLMPPDAHSVDREAVDEAHSAAHLEVLVTHHDIRYAMEVGRDDRRCVDTQQERG